MSGSNYKTLVAWQRAMDLSVSIYNVTDHFPHRERYGLAAQMSRAAISAPSNIAEGRGRGSNRDYRRFLLHARGSLYELETQLEIAKRLHFIDEAQAAELEHAIAEAIRPLNGLIRSTSASPARRSP